MPLPILGARRQQRQAEHDAKTRAERTELIAKTVASVVPPADRRGRNPVDAAQLAQQITQTLNPSVAVIPEEIQAALEAQGMNWQGQFGPGRPLQPFAGYNSDPRAFNYTPGRNVSAQPRSDRIPFNTLKQIIDGYDVAQICIQHVINDLCSMPLLFQPLEGVQSDVSAEINAAKAFLRRPDGKRPFRRWLSMWWQDILRYDAGALYKQPDRAGRLKALKVIEGPTIAPLVDYWGDIPDAPAPAYLQFVEGMPWDWMDETQLIYQPFTPLRESPYGLAPIECVLLNANTDVRFQWYFLQYFTEGSLPATWMKAPPDMSDPDALADWQETWDAWLLGDQAKKHQVRWIPAGADPVPAKDTVFNENFPEYLMRRTVAAFMLTPQDLGFTDDVNRATADTQVDVQFRISSQPRTGYVEDILNQVLQEDLGLRVEVRFDDGREKEDRLQEAQSWQIYIASGMASADEGREQVLGLPTNPEEITPRIFDSQRLGPIPLSYIIATAGEIDMETAAPLPGTVQPRALVLPGMVSPDPGNPAAVVNDEDPELEPASKVGRVPGLTAGEAALAAPNGDVDDPALSKALRRWRDNSRSRVRRGQPPRMFEDPGLPAHVAERVWADLSKAASRDQVDAVFAKADIMGGGDVDPKAGRPGPGGPFEQDLVDYWAARLAEQLKVQVEPGRVAREWLATNPPHTAGPPAAPLGAAAPDTLSAAAQAFAASLHLDQQPLTDTLRGLYRDAWAAGEKDSVDQMVTAGAQPNLTIARAVTGVDWSAWQPGHPAAADRLTAGGMDRMLQQAGVTISGVNDTTRARIADTLEAGVRRGDSVDTIAAEITKVVSDPARAQLIAVTEVNRAMTQASIDSYRQSGIGMFNLLVSPGACIACVTVAEANPHPLDEIDAQPPIHPRCRCAAQPVA